MVQRANQHDLPVDGGEPIRSALCALYALRLTRWQRRQRARSRLAARCGKRSGALNFSAPGAVSCCLCVLAVGGSYPVKNVAFRDGVELCRVAAAFSRALELRKGDSPEVIAFKQDAASCCFTGRGIVM